jgi:hypothetical protein
MNKKESAVMRQYLTAKLPLEDLVVGIPIILEAAITFLIL